MPAAIPFIPAIIGAGAAIYSAKKGSDASKKQTKANKNASAEFSRLAAQARSDALNLFPASIENSNLGFQSALDVLGGVIPQQLDSFRRGNMNAQNTLLSGLPQMNNAILGLPTDLSGLRAKRVKYNDSYAQQQLPDFITTQQALGSQAPQRPGVVIGAQIPYYGNQPVGHQPSGNIGGGFNPSALLAGFNP